MRANSLFLIATLVLAACGSGGGGPRVAPAALTILPTSLPNGAPGSAYSVTLSGGGGTGTGYEWRVVSGSLPPGLTGLPASGRTPTLQGFPSAEGTYGFTVELRDSSGASTTILYSIAITSGVPGPGPGTMPTSLVNAPSPRGLHTAVWTGTEMIVWGGVDSLGPMNTGAAYDPATDTWRTLTTTGAPSARFDHTVVWTGSEMIVWGGTDSAGALGTGGAYDPATNTWRPLSTAGAPERRLRHSAVWSGSRMIVWGGEGVFPPPAPNSVDKVFADGFAYDPATDTWTAIATPTLLALRGHSAIWTGSGMIVWGGQDSFALGISTQNKGGLYGPAADSWKPTGVATAPAPRAGHTAVWTGSAMVVWGGYGNTGAGMQTGSRYAPATDSWTATTTANAPGARSGHTAVWTGTEMLVWGGRGGTSGYLGDGALYDPAGNAWRALPAGFAPTPRTGHTAVWTGTAMIVWGGATTPTETYLNSGAILAP